MSTAITGRGSASRAAPGEQIDGSALSGIDLIDGRAYGVEQTHLAP